MKELSIVSQTLDFNDYLGEPEEFKGKIFSLKLNNVYKESFLGNLPMPS